MNDEEYGTKSNHHPPEAHSLCCCVSTNVSAPFGKLEQQLLQLRGSWE